MCIHRSYIMNTLITKRKTQNFEIFYSILFLPFFLKVGTALLCIRTQQMLLLFSGILYFTQVWIKKKLGDHVFAAV
jgi:hypothetical protein